MNKIAAKRQANQTRILPALNQSLLTMEDMIVELIREKDQLRRKIREEKLKEGIIEELIQIKELEERERNL